MSRRELVISNEAAADLVEIWVYIAGESPDRADQFVDEIYAKCSVLAENPSMGRARDTLIAGMRSFPIGRYLIFYRLVGEEQLQIVRVLSGYRDLDDLF